MRQTAHVAPGVARASGISATALIGTHLWMDWLRIVVDRRQTAIDARARVMEAGPTGAGFGEALMAEMQASMVAISSAAAAIDAVYGEIKPMVMIPQALIDTWEENGTARHDRIFETLKKGCRLGDRTNRWPREFDFVYLLRDPVVHHELKRLPAVPHPCGLTEVSQEMADYCVENVHRAADLAFDVILTALRRPRAPDLVKWAQAMPHVPGDVEAFRTTA